MTAKRRQIEIGNRIRRTRQDLAQKIRKGLQEPEIAGHAAQQRRRQIEAQTGAFNPLLDRFHQRRESLPGPAPRVVAGRGAISGRSNKP